MKYLIVLAVSLYNFSLFADVIAIRTASGEYVEVELNELHKALNPESGESKLYFECVAKDIKYRTYDSSLVLVDRKPHTKISITRIYQFSLKDNCEALKVKLNESSCVRTRSCDFAFCKLEGYSPDSVGATLNQLLSTSDGSLSVLKIEAFASIKDCQKFIN